jgi:hypothetical protein
LVLKKIKTGQGCSTCDDILVTSAASNLKNRLLSIRRSFLPLLIRFVAQAP